MTAQTAYELFAAYMWRRIALWSLGSINRPYWPEVGNE